jgi:capsule polysaccharide export protein KpsE/RkpR
LLRLAFIGLVVAPTLLSAFYYTLIASHRFVSEAQFSAARSEMRAHSGDSALEIVARLIESEIANKNTRIISMIP